ncbi:MAG: ankyrin repeat domain-containing protein [Alphaproteobacteria bacterium]|nr:ankyrin repeat domain-containing protein [Alphaproteobacteria bacterium]
MKVFIGNNLGYGSSTLSETETVFLEAIKTGNTQQIQELISKGIDINKKLDFDVPLAIAVRYEQPEVVRLLLNNQADFTALNSMDKYNLLFLFRTEIQSFITKYNINVQEPDENGISLIQRAMFQDDLEFFKIFVQVSGRLKDDVVHKVIQNCSVEFLRYLIQEGYDIKGLNAAGEPPIVSAVQSGNPEMVRVLVDAGVDVNTITVNGQKVSLYDYIPNGDREMFRMLVACNASLQETTEEGDTELHKAVRNGNIFKIRALIAAGIDVNAQNEAGNTAMHLAMEQNHHIAYAFMSECRVHNVSLNLNLQNYDGNTPFHFLVTKQRGISTLLPIMLENGADINVQNNEGNTPLHFAGKLLNLEAIQLFLANGANPYIQNFWGNTPYHFVHAHRTNPKLSRSVWECIALFNDQNIDIRRLSTTENKSGQSVQSMGREEFQFPLIDESSIPRIYSIPRPQTPSSAMPAPIDFDAPMVSNGPPIPILPPQSLEESNIPILPVQVEPMQYSGSNISPMMDPPPLNPTPPMPPTDKEEIKHEDIPLSVDAVPPVSQSEIPLPQPAPVEMVPPPQVQIEPMQYSENDISPISDPPPLNPTPPMPPTDKEEIKHEDIPLSVDAVPPVSQSEIPLPQPAPVGTIMPEQLSSFVRESVVPVSINTSVSVSTTNIPILEPVPIENIILNEAVSGEGNSSENDAVIDSNKHNLLTGKDVITDDSGVSLPQPNMLHGEGNGKPPTGIAAKEIVFPPTNDTSNTLNELKNSENGVNTDEHLSGQGNGIDLSKGVGTGYDGGTGNSLLGRGNGTGFSGEANEGYNGGTGNSLLGRGNGTGLSGEANTGYNGGTGDPLSGQGNGSGSAERDDDREEDGLPMDGLSDKEEDVHSKNLKPKKKKQKPVESFVPPIIPERLENKENLTHFEPIVIPNHSQGMQVVPHKRKNEKKRMAMANVPPEKLSFWERNWKWIVGVATVIATTLGAYFLIRKAKKKTKAVKSETIRLKSQIKTLQTSISDMTEGVSDKDLQKSSVLSNSSSLINEYSQSDVIVGASKQHELF